MEAVRRRPLTAAIARALAVVAFALLATSSRAAGRSGPEATTSIAGGYFPDRTHGLG